RRVPRILPFIRHQDDVAIVQMLPFAVAPVPALRWRRRLIGIAREPVLDDVVVKLLAPKQASVGLPRDALRVGREIRRDARAVEIVGLSLALAENPLEASIEGLLWRLLR